MFCTRKLSIRLCSKKNSSKDRVFLPGIECFHFQAFVATRLFLFVSRLAVVFLSVVPDYTNVRREPHTISFCNIPCELSVVSQHELSLGRVILNHTTSIARINTWCKKWATDTVLHNKWSFTMPLDSSGYPLPSTFQNNWWNSTRKDGLFNS
jgi:hypothetical protein